jgi:hypothetical protein
MIPRGWMMHPELSDGESTVIVPDPTYFGARADPPPAPRGRVWRSVAPCGGYRLEEAGRPRGYEPDRFAEADPGAIWDAVREIGRAR